MSYKILTKNGIDNSNIDGARAEYFNSGMRDGIVQGVLNEGTFIASSSNVISFDTCELRIAGHRIVINEPVYHTFTNAPSSDTRYAFVAQIVVDDNQNVDFSLFVQIANTPLIQNDLYKTITGAGTYQLEIGKFTQLSDGTLTDVTRTADLITGGDGSGDSEYIRIGTVTTNKISPELDADVDIENTINPDDNKPQTNFTFNLPTPSGTVVSLNGVEKTSINTDTTPTANSENLITSGGVHDYPAITFAESERQKSKNLLDINKAELKTGSEAFSTLLGGTITINAGNQFCYISSLTNLCNLKPNIPYTLSYVTNNGRSYIYQYIEGGTGFTWNNGETKTFTQTELDSIANNLLLLYGSTDSTVTYSNIQVEEGSTATDYQPYYGEIVHQGDIPPVLLYDKTSQNVFFGTAYPVGIPTQTEITSGVDFSPYKKLKVYYTHNNQYFGYADIDLTKQTFQTEGGNGTWCCLADDGNAICGATFQVKTNSFKCTANGFTKLSPLAYNSRPTSTNSAYYVYRIEGIK